MKRQWTEEQRQHLRDLMHARNAGVPKTDEQKRKMSEARMGRKDSPETKLKKSQAQKEYNAAIREIMLQQPYLTCKECETIYLNSADYKEKKAGPSVDINKEATIPITSK